MTSHTPSQRYLSTRGGSYGLSFEEVVLKGLAADGGLFIPEEIPTIPEDWHQAWGSDLSFSKLAVSVLAQYISPAEIPRMNLEDIVERSYASFRARDVTPLVTLKAEERLHVLELFHGPTFAFKDVALQLLGNIFEYFLVRRNQRQAGGKRHHLTIIGATSGDTGSAAIYGLRGKQDVSVFILHPRGKISPVQEAQMTTVLDANVHNLAVEGTFDDCQNAVKALFADPEINASHNLGAVNSINWARILAQITYYFHAFASLRRSAGYREGDRIRFVVPTGNFGDILAGYYAKRMGLPIEKLVVATNENDILDRFWQTGRYEKQARRDAEAEGGIVEDGVKAHADGVKETLSPAMDILVSSNFERLLWYLAFEAYGGDDAVAARKIAGEHVKQWQSDLKSRDGFSVEPAVLDLAHRDFESERVSDSQTLETIKEIYHSVPATVSTEQKESVESRRASPRGYVLDPHSAIGVAAAVRSMKRAAPATHHVSLATAHPAKFGHAVKQALGDGDGDGDGDFDFDAVLPEQFVGLETRPRRVRVVPGGGGWEAVRAIIREETEAAGV